MTKLTQVGVWIKDHFMLGVFTALAIVAFFFVPHLQEMIYATIRSGYGVLLISLLIWIWFKDTVRNYLVTGGFLDHFNGLEPKYKVGFTLFIIYMVSRFVADCITRP